jgi:hypothetical protein
MNDTVGNGSLVEGAEAVLVTLPGIGGPVNRHMPVRPAWTCVADDQPWPCPSARVHLRAEYAGDRSALAVYMSQQLMTAAVDIADRQPLPPDLFDRFLAWT